MKYLSLSLFLSILQKSSKIFRNTIGITTLGTRLKDYRKNERKKKKKITTLIKTIPQNSMINGGAIKRERDFSNPSAEPIALLLPPTPPRRPHNSFRFPQTPTSRSPWRKKEEGRRKEKDGEGKGGSRASIHAFIFAESIFFAVRWITRK